MIASSSIHQIERIVQEHLQYVRESISDGWDLIHQEGEMKVYRREVEENGIVIDPLKCFHTIKVNRVDKLLLFRLHPEFRALPVMKSVDIFGNINIEWNGKVRMKKPFVHSMSLFFIASYT